MGEKASGVRRFTPGGSRRMGAVMWMSGKRRRKVPDVSNGQDSEREGGKGSLSVRIGALSMIIVMVSM